VRGDNLNIPSGGLYPFGSPPRAWGQFMR